MSSDVAISVRGLSKSYTIRHNQEHHTTFGEAMVHRLKHPLQRPETEEFWALDDVSFDVKQGEVLGVIGRNGAGKSTLLKVLSRITSPTKGEIDIYGRVGSLLEVGTGFHPELTGRENIYLNGSILGMRRKEIDERFDEIVDFAGVEQFLDTPVKRYSSGMYVRLAFSVAAHLDCHVLLVDEVLAVGDAEFQEKSLARMHAVADGGATVVFVSHQLTAVTSLCDRVAWLADGGVRQVSDAFSTVAAYLDVSAHGSTRQRPPASGTLNIAGARVQEATIEPLDTVAFDIDVESHDERDRYWIAAHVVDASGRVVYQCDSRLVLPLIAGSTTSQFVLRAPRLKPGPVHVDLFLCTSGGVVDRFDDAMRFTVLPTLPYPQVPNEEMIAAGVVLPDLEVVVSELQLGGGRR